MNIEKLKDYFYLWLQKSAINDFRYNMQPLMLGICLMFWVNLIPYFILQILVIILFLSLFGLYGELGEYLYQKELKKSLGKH